MIYLFLLLIIVCFSYKFDYKKESRYKDIAYYSVMVALIAIAAFRYRIGVDTIRYEANYIFIPTLFDLSSYDFMSSRYAPLSLLFFSLGKTLSSDFWVFQLLQSILVNVVFFRFVKNNTKNVFFAILIYYTFLYFNFMCEVMREACAVSMLLLGWEYLKKDNWLVFSCFCLLAYGFHSSSVVLFLLPFTKFFGLWKFLRINKCFIIILVVVYIGGVIIQKVFFDYLILFDLSDRITSSAVSYSETELASAKFNLFGILFSIVKYILFPLGAFVLLKKNKIVENNHEQMLFLCFVFVVLTIPISIFYRYNNYFFPFAIVILSNWIYNKELYANKKYVIKCKSFIGWYIILFPMFYCLMRSYMVNVYNDSRLLLMR